MSEVVIAFVAFSIALTVGVYVFAMFMFPRRIPEEELAADSEYRPLVERYRNSEGHL